MAPWLESLISSNGFYCVNWGFFLNELSGKTRLRLVENWFGPGGRSAKMGIQYRRHAINCLGMLVTQRARSLSGGILRFFVRVKGNSVWFGCVLEFLFFIFL